MDNKDGFAFSSIDVVAQCLLDKQRTEMFKKAIEETVKPGNKVVDLGTGSGVMALFAAKQGAEEVYGVEFDPYVAHIAQKNFQKNNFKGMHIVQQDARTLTLENPILFDIVIMEMLTTGMIDEHQLEAVNNLHRKGYINSDTIFIPHTQKTFVSLAYADYNIYGIHTEMPIHNWNWYPKNLFNVQKYSEPILLNSINFKKEHRLDFSAEIAITTAEDGIVNSIIVTSESLLTKDIILGDTLALNAPMVVPIESFNCKANEKYHFIIKYNFGEGFEKFSAKKTK